MTFHNGLFNRTIAVDFDGVIHQYEEWCDVSNDPIDGAFEGLYALMEKYAVFIFCARPYETASEDPPRARAGLRDIPSWFEQHGFKHPVICDLSLETRFWTQRNVLLVTNQKLPAWLYIDDRAITFTSWKQTRQAVSLCENADTYARE